MFRRARSKKWSGETAIEHLAQPEQHRQRPKLAPTLEPLERRERRFLSIYTEPVRRSEHSPRTAAFSGFRLKDRA